MYRPNRIGSYMITDISAADHVFDQTAANYVTNQGTFTAHEVQTDTATLGDPVTCVNFDTADTIDDLVIATNKTWSFGRFISGAALNNRNMMLAYSAEVMVKFDATYDRVSLQLYLGMHNTTSVTVDKTAQVNLIDNKCQLDSGVLEANMDMICLSARGVVINSLFNGGASGEFDTNPIGLYYCISAATGPVVVIQMIGSLSLYRYSEDIDTFDPNR